jgi:hypothetical protein
MTDKAISPLRRRLIEDMAIRRLSPKTQLHYTSAEQFGAGRFIIAATSPCRIAVRSQPLAPQPERKFAGWEPEAGPSRPSAGE